MCQCTKCPTSTLSKCIYQNGCGKIDREILISFSHFILFSHFVKRSRFLFDIDKAAIYSFNWALVFFFRFGVALIVFGEIKEQMHWNLCLKYVPMIYVRPVIGFGSSIRCSNGPIRHLNVSTNLLCVFLFFTRITSFKIVFFIFPQCYEIYLL